MIKLNRQKCLIYRIKFEYNLSVVRNMQVTIIHSLFHRLYRHEGSFNSSLLESRGLKRVGSGRRDTLWRRGQVVGEKDSVLLEGRETQRDVSGPMEKLRHRTRMQTASPPPPPRMLIEYAKSLLRAPPIEMDSRTDFFFFYARTSTHIRFVYIPSSAIQNFTRV